MSNRPPMLGLSGPASDRRRRRLTSDDARLFAIAFGAGFVFLSVFLA